MARRSEQRRKLVCRILGHRWEVEYSQDEYGPQIKGYSFDTLMCWRCGFFTVKWKATDRDREVRLRRAELMRDGVLAKTDEIIASYPEGSPQRTLVESAKKRYGSQPLRLFYFLSETCWASPRGLLPEIEQEMRDNPHLQEELTEHLWELVHRFKRTGQLDCHVVF